MRERTIGVRRRAHHTISTVRFTSAYGQKVAMIGEPRFRARMSGGHGRADFFNSGHVLDIFA
eukprot:scaffold109014_cov30-Tisochrysis_lutea.AAC.3